MTEMNYEEFRDEAVRMISDAVIQNGFKGIKFELNIIIDQLLQNTKFNRSNIEYQKILSEKNSKEWITEQNSKCEKLFDELDKEL